VVVKSKDYVSKTQSLYIYAYIHTYIYICIYIYVYIQHTHTNTHTKKHIVHRAIYYPVELINKTTLTQVRFVVSTTPPRQDLRWWLKSKDYVSKTDYIVNSTSLIQARANPRSLKKHFFKTYARPVCEHHHHARVQGGNQVQGLCEQK